jgi:hypothetical protein
MSSFARKFMAIVIATSVAPSLIAAAADAPVGQWTGNSQIDGDRATAKTTLSLGAPESEDSTLRIQGNSDCTLKQGSYSADSAGGWTLSFKQPMGGDVCTRLAKGTFVLRAGTGPKQINFDVKYPGADGRETKRYGTLNRYP